MSNDILSDLSIVTTLSAPDGTVSFSKTEPLAQLLPGALKDYSYAVNLANAPLGQYKASARVLASDGTPLAGSQAMVTVQAAPSLDVRGAVSATPSVVMINQPVAISASVTATAAVSSLPLTLAVVDPATSLVLQQWTDNVANLAAGAAYQLAPQTWKAAGKSGDNLLAVLSASVGGKYVNLAKQTLSLAPSLSQRVSGSLALSSATPMLGAPLTLAGNITNSGDLDLSNLDVSVTIIDPAHPEAPLFSQTAAGLALAKGASSQSTASWVVAGVAGVKLSAVYRVALNGDLVELARQDFVPLQKLADAIKGSVTLSTTTPLPGDDLSIGAGIVNLNAAAIPGLAVRLLVVDPKAPEVALYSKNATLDLGGNQTQVVNGNWSVNAPANAQLEARVMAVLGAESVLLASQPFSVRPKAVVSATQELGGRVLVYFSCRPDWEDHDHYKYWERKAPCFGERRQFIETLLNSLGIPHKIVDDEEEFAEAFRSHRYNTYWLLGAFTHFGGKLVDELKESVYRGDALILDSGLHAWRNWDLLETAGARYRGRLYCIRQEISTLGKLFAAANLATEGWPLMLEANNGVVEAVYQANLVSDVEDDDDDRQGEKGEYKHKTAKPGAAIFPAIISNVYGKGRVLLFNFDLLDTLMDTQNPNWAVLARDAFAYLKPQDASISMLGGSMPLDIRLSSKGDDVTVKAQLALPPGASLIDSKPAASVEGGKPTWTVTIKKSEFQVIQAALSGPIQPGEAHAVTQVSDAGGGYIATLDTRYTVLDANQAAAQANAALGALNVATNEKSYRDKAVKNIGDAQSDVKRGRFEQAIRELTEAADFAARIQKADPAAARQAIDRWLRDIEIASLEADKPNKPPAAFPPKGECKVHAGISGKDSDRSLDIDFEPKADDLGKTGDTFVAAVLEVDGVPRWFFLKPTGWTLWQGGAVPQYSSGILGAKTLHVLDKLDTSGFVGAAIYAGYRVGNGEVKLYPAFTVR